MAPKYACVHMETVPKDAIRIELVNGWFPPEVDKGTREGEGVSLCPECSAALVAAEKRRGVN
jgi:hypothetical protein